jgi:hypothetical protein
MKAKQLVEWLTKLAEELRDLQERLEKMEIPREDLERFKSVVDDTRISLWAALSLTEEELTEGVAHFRLKRTEEMCRQVGLDIEHGSLTLENPDLALFYTTLKDTAGRIDGLQQATAE